MAGQITAIHVQKRNSNRANVYIDGEFAFGVQMIHAARLHTGQYLSDEDIAALRQEDEAERAYEHALTFLSYRPRSQAEVARRLRKKGYADSTITLAIDRLCRASLLDDKAFAEYWIQNREQFRPRGSRALRYELRQKGVDPGIIDASLSQVDEAESAYRVAAERIDRWQRARNTPDLDARTLRRKLTAYLARRGFGYAVIREVWDRLVTERLADIWEQEREEETAWDQ